MDYLDHWRELCKQHGPDYVRQCTATRLNDDEVRAMHQVLWELQKNQDAERSAEAARALAAAERSANYAKWAAGLTLVAAVVGPLIDYLLG